MTRILINKLLKNFSLLLLFPALLKAQEGLRPLTANPAYIYKDLQKTGAALQHQRTGSLSLPFRDDFSYAYKQSYPSQSLWMDSSTYVNTGHAVAPLSLGVATFDGLDKHGWPYTPNLQNMLQSLPADTLRSRPINLSGLNAGDSVALIFSYQARGRGDAPEASDSLVVDLYKPNQNSWTKAWASKGNTSPNTYDTVFKRVIVRITDTAYLFDNFQFRFRNRATTAGDFDHWHVDYVALSKFPDVINDTLPFDVAFGYVPGPVLAKYSEMPWQQYTPSELVAKQSVFIRNNFNALQNTTYGNILYDSNSLPLGGAPDDAENLSPFFSSGWDPFANHATPSFTYAFSSFSDSAEFTIRHRLYTGITLDSFPSNDTVIQHIKFKNYYAFDDGSAEGGYYINGTGGKMAVKIKLNVPDTLRALRIYFDPVGNMSINQNTLGTAQSSYKFRIILWTDAGGTPGFLLLRDSLQNVKYYNAGDFNMLPEYKLTSPIPLSAGNYYIGIQQYVASGITVGFDKNLNHSSSLWFDSGSGWTQSSIYGSLMLRPVFGKVIPPPVGIREFAGGGSVLAELYPNPANETITIHLKENTNVSYRLINALGQIVEQERTSETITVVNTSHLSNGVYFMELSSKGEVQRKKIIIQH